MNTTDIVKSSLSLAEMISFGCGPAGVIVGGALGIFQLGFELLIGGDKSTPINLPSEINEILQADLANDHVQSDLAQIVGATKWLSEQSANVINGTYDDDYIKKYPDDYEQLKETVNVYCDPANSLLLHAVADLENATYPSDIPFSILGLPSFMLGATTHLTFEKIRLLMSTDATTFKSPNATFIVNAAKDYIEHINNTVTAIDNFFNDRLGGISKVVQSVDMTSGAFIRSSYIHFCDDKATTPPTRKVVDRGALGKNVVWGNKCGKSISGLFKRTCPCSNVEVRNASQKRSSYINDLTNDLKNVCNYSDERKKDIADTISALQNDVELYEACIT